MTKGTFVDPQRKQCFLKLPKTKTTNGNTSLIRESKMDSFKASKLTLVSCKCYKPGLYESYKVLHCFRPNEPCDLPTGSQVLDFHSVCKQKFSYRRLLSINEKGQPIAETFKIPSACCCSYKRKFDFFSRIGK